MDSSQSRTAPIQPFWHRISKFFLYGLKPQPLILAIAMFAQLWFLDIGPFHLVLALVILKYSMVALQQTAEGYLSPPKLSYKILIDNYGLPIKVFILLGCWVFLYFKLAAAGGLWVAIPLMVLGILLFPAVLIALAMTESFLFAVNPLNAWSIAYRIGWPYLTMFLFLLLFGIASETAQALLLEHAADEYLLPLWLAVTTFFTIVTFHLMGYVILQYHDKLGGAKPEALAKEAAEQSTVATSPLLERFIAEGNVEAAAEEFAGLIKDNPEDLALRRRMYVYLVSNDQHKRLKKYLPSYFEALMEAGSINDATKLFLDSAQRGQPFTPADPGNYLPLMQELRRRRLSQEAAKLASGFHTRFTGSTNIPEVYFEMAQILADDLRRDDVAKKALKFILKQFPEHELVPRVEQYLAFLERLQSQTPA